MNGVQIAQQYNVYLSLGLSEWALWAFSVVILFAGGWRVRKKTVTSRG